MTPLGRYSLYCDHGIHVGSECVRCWQRRALDAEEALKACAGCVERDQRIGLLESAARVMSRLINERLKQIAASQATLAELREELAQAQNALANAH
jgi:hypothetical protein